MSTPSEITDDTLLGAAARKQPNPMARYRTASSIVRIGAWVGIGVVALLSLLPDGRDLDLDLPEPVQHFGAYLFLSIVLAIAYPAHRIWSLVGLVSVAAGLELLQNLSPGRDPSWLDAGVSGSGAVVGWVLIEAYRGIKRRGVARSRE